MGLRVYGAEGRGYRGLRVEGTGAEGRGYSTKLRVKL